MAKKTEQRGRGRPPREDNPVRVNIMLSEKAVERADGIAETRGMSRSQVIEEAILSLRRARKSQ